MLWTRARGLRQDDPLPLGDAAKMLPPLEKQDSSGVYESRVDVYDTFIYCNLICFCVSEHGIALIWWFILVSLGQFMAIGEEKVMIFHSKVMKPQKPEPGKKRRHLQEKPHSWWGKNHGFLWIFTLTNPLNLSSNWGVSLFVIFDALFWQIQGNQLHTPQVLGIARPVPVLSVAPQSMTHPLWEWRRSCQNLRR